MLLKQEHECTRRKMPIVHISYALTNMCYESQCKSVCAPIDHDLKRTIKMTHFEV